MGCVRSQRVLKWVGQTKKGFTLLELLVVVSIILVLSAIAMYLHQRGLAHAKEKVCQTNLRALQTAVELYAAENGALPGILTHLEPEHVEKGYAKAMEDNGWLIKAYTLLIKLDASDHAYAEFLTYENLKEYGVTEKIFHCPADHNGGASYGINTDMEGESWANAGSGAILIADCDSHTFNSPNQLKPRHKNMAIGISQGGEIVKINGHMRAAIEKREEKGEIDEGEDAYDGHGKEDKEQYWKNDKELYDERDNRLKHDADRPRRQGTFKNWKNAEDDAHVLDTEKRPRKLRLGEEAYDEEDARAMKERGKRGWD